MSSITGVRPLVLALLDGWGVRAERDANAIALARTPIYDRLAATSPHALLAASGDAIGLAPGRAAYAQAAYATLGAGRVVEQTATAIARRLHGNGAAGLAAHPTLQRLVARVRPLGGAIHLVGMVTPSGIAGQQRHLAVLAALLSHEGVRVWVHAIMDGQDTRPQSGIEHLAEFLDDIAGAGNATLASVMGRTFGFDDMTDPAALAAAWRAMAEAEAPLAEYPTAYLDQCYRKGLNDDAVPPAIAAGYRGIRQDDALLLVNLQPNDALPLMRALLDPVTAGLAQRAPSLCGVCSLVRLDRPLGDTVEALYVNATFDTSFADVLARGGQTQLVLTETAAESNLWNFARGGHRSLLPGESVLVADTPARLEKRPEMASAALTSEVLAALKARDRDVIVVEFANAAILGRTGNMRATIAAIEAVDKCLGKIAAQIEKRGGVLALCGTYGKAELMIDPETGGPWRATTASDVPFVLAGGAPGQHLGNGALADVAPTLLALLGLRAPPEMTGRSLLAASQAQSRISA